MVGGHAQYVKGYAEQTVGKVTSTEPWKSSAHTDKVRQVKCRRCAS